MTNTLLGRIPEPKIIFPLLLLQLLQTFRCFPINQNHQIHPHLDDEDGFPNTWSWHLPSLPSAPSSYAQRCRWGHRDGGTHFHHDPLFPPRTFVAPKKSTMQTTYQLPQQKGMLFWVVPKFGAVSQMFFFSFRKKKKIPPTVALVLGALKHPSGLRSEI